MCIVPQRNNALYNIVDDDTIEYLSSVSFQLYKQGL